MLAQKPHLLTAEGLSKLKDELHELETTEREKVADRLNRAFEDGQDDDFVDNAELEAARNAQSFLEGRIRQLREILSNYEVIEEDKKPHNVVKVGDTVKVREDGQDDLEKYHIVGPAEADPLAGRISNESPLGRALINSKVGDVVEVQAPQGLLSFVIVEIG